jgi:3-oxoacyl-[acyl-carrier protein] reductase
MSPQIRQMRVTQTPAGRLGTPSDTTELVRFLISDAGGSITGQTLHSNGGFKTG